MRSGTAIAALLLTLSVGCTPAGVATTGVVTAIAGGVLIGVSQPCERGDLTCHESINDGFGDLAGMMLGVTLLVTGAALGVAGLAMKASPAPDPAPTAASVPASPLAF